MFHRFYKNIHLYRILDKRSAQLCCSFNQNFDAFLCDWWLSVIGQSCMHRFKACKNASKVKFLSKVQYLRQQCCCNWVIFSQASKNRHCNFYLWQGGTLKIINWHILISQMERWAFYLTAHLHQIFIHLILKVTFSHIIQLCPDQIFIFSSSSPVCMCVAITF